MNVPNIALVGRTRSGKDLVYKILAEQGYHVQRVAFGDAMKEKFYELFPQFVGQPKPTKHIIHFGQSMRQIDSDVWVNLAMNAIKVHTVLYDQYGIEKPSYVFTDVRQANELEACKKLGCIVVKVVAPDEVRVKRMEELGESTSQEVLTAKTETDLEGFEYDFTLFNAGSVEDLEDAVEELLQKLTKEG